MQCKVVVFQPIDHVSVNPTDGIRPTQGQRKTEENFYTLSIYSLRNEKTHLF